MLIICQIDWREVGVAFELQCLRNCTLSSLNKCTLRYTYDILKSLRTALKFDDF